MSANKKIRHWCFTSFKMDQNWDIEGYRYLIVGKETCPESGRLHWQGYIELNGPQRMSYIKKIFNDNTIHLEIRKGTREQARDYCKKDGNYQEYGNWIKGQGARTDLSEVVEILKEKKLSDFMLEDPETYCRYRNGLKDIAGELAKRKSKEFRKLEVTLITGPTNANKTRLANEKTTFKIEGDNLDWWCGYDGDESILIDEYDNQIKITKLLNLLDGYSLRLPIKGGQTYAAWNKVYITTNLKLSELHANAKPAHRHALKRRIHTIINLWDNDDAIDWGLDRSL